jgi:LacI family transcriptional regulator
MEDPSMSVTIKDIARIAGVSYSTVSKALNDSPLVQEKTKDKILLVAKQLGYQPNIAAKTLVSKKSFTIGAVWPTIERVALSSLVTKINEKLTERGYNMILSINPVESAIATFNQFHADGIIVFQEQPGHWGRKDQVMSNVPILTYGDPGISPNVVNVNRRKAIMDAVEYLTNLGHERIAYIGIGYLPNTQSFQQDKFLGFTEGIIKFGLHSHPDMVQNTNGYNWQDGYQTTKKLLQTDYNPTAIICGSYDLTVGAIRAIKEAHLRIPDDISIIGYDNIPEMENLDVPISVVGAPIEDIAAKTVDSLLSLIDDPDYSEEFTEVQSKLVVRESCKPPRS